MRFATLGSGSAGNAAVLEAGGVRVLVDVGLSARQICQRLAQMGIRPDSLDAIILTHEHSDHTRGLRVLLKNLEIPVYATPMTAEVLRPGLTGVRWKIFESGGRFALKGLEIESFPVPHDAVEPVGYVFHGADRKFGFLSDTGHVTAEMIRRLRGVRGMFVEANYDEDLLEADPKRPWSVKQRIASRHGHLSNTQVSELVGKLVQDGLRRILLGHLSSDCNRPEVILAALSRHGIHTACASQGEPSDWCDLSGDPATASIRQEVQLRFL